MNMIKLNILTACVGLMTLNLVLTSCSNNQKAEDTKEVAEDQNKVSVEKSLEGDAQFLVDAAEINMIEIQLGQLAQKKGTLQAVKDLGAMMEKDHTAKLGELKTLAVNKQMTIPSAMTEKSMEVYKKFSEMEIKDFDKAYCNEMIDGHENAISMFEKQAKEGVDGEINTWANNTLPALRMHLDHSKECKEKLQ